MVKEVVDRIRTTEEELKKKERLAVKEKEDLILTTKEQILRLQKYAQEDNQTRRKELMESIDIENEQLLQNAISKGSDEAEELRRSVEGKKDKVIDEVLSAII